ncbi:uncharacterized protein VTP21DRAFT_9551 [Calcarisporiella thermophila]|uniref:uncharacterized protein n=1 Tax=Calcarisporiella thermophila TaxID=911321 RepID=UPI0037435D94
MLAISKFLGFLLLFITPFALAAKRDFIHRHYYAIELHPSADAVPTEVADLLQARWEGPIGELEYHHLFSAERGTPDGEATVEMLRKRREGLEKRQSELIDAVVWVRNQPPRQLVRRAPVPVEQSEKTELEKRKKRPGEYPVLASVLRELDIKDPGFSNQWHLFNEADPGNDINVTTLWKQGIRGNGSVVAILDDGLDMDSEDLSRNFVGSSRVGRVSFFSTNLALFCSFFICSKFAPGSYDFNDQAILPKPQLFDDTHGTRCAGEIAAVKNTVCGIGVAYEAKIAGIRILSGEITEADEAAALNFAFQYNHIYSCSWGPPDNGEAVEAPQGLVRRAIMNGIEKGRAGKGSIYVFASGNGGGFDDNCNFDGYTNSIYTVTVGAIDHLNAHPYYSEKCSAQLAVTYSSGSGSYIYTTDVEDLTYNRCTSRHGGTSAAAPIASGIFALVLSLRPDLSWRDIQHLCVQTAVPISLEDDDWEETAAGRMFNHKYGYGKLDAGRMVEAARGWQTVEPQVRVKMKTVMVDTELPQDEVGLTSVLRVNPENVVTLKRLEHVVVTVNLEHERRGDVEIYLISPNGVTSQLAARRRFDTSSEGLVDWSFMSVKHWEEDPVGVWALRVVDRYNPESSGRFIDWRLIFYGEGLGEEAMPTLPLSSDPEPGAEVGGNATDLMHPPENPAAAPPTTSLAPIPTHFTNGSNTPLTASPIDPGPALPTPLEASVADHPKSLAGHFPYLALGAALVLAALAIYSLVKRWRSSTPPVGEQVEQSSSRDSYEFAALESETDVEEVSDREEEAGDPGLAEKERLRVSFSDGE